MNRPVTETVGSADGLVNLRDIGGLPVRGGGRTRSGVLYRSDAPYPGDRRPESVSVWPPVSVLDLRSQRETDHVGYQWDSGTVVHHSPLHDDAAPTTGRPTSLAGMYRTIVGNDAPRVARAASVVMRAAGPVLVHCTVGKDRTGIVVAALLLAVDVEPDAVIEDYLETASNIDALRARWVAKGVIRPGGKPIREEFMQAPSEAISAVVDLMTGWRGGPRAWMSDHGVDIVDVDSWHKRLVDDGSTAEGTVLK